MEHASRIWTIRFIAFCVLYLALFRSGFASDAVSAALQGLHRIGGIWAFVLSPLLAAAGAVRALTGRIRIILVLPLAAGLAFLFLTGERLVMEFVIVGALGFLGAILGWWLAILAGVSLAFGAGINGAGGAAALGPLGDILAALTGQSALANILIIAGAILIPLFAPKLSDWFA